MKTVSGAQKRKTFHIWMNNCVKCRFQQTLKHTHADDAQMSCTKCRRTVPERASFCNTLLSQADWNAPQRASQSILMLIDGRLKEASWSLRPVCLTRFKCADCKPYIFTPDLHWCLMNIALKNLCKSLVPIRLTCLSIFKSLKDIYSLFEGPSIMSAKFLQTELYIFLI